MQRKMAGDGGRWSGDEPSPFISRSFASLQKIVRLLKFAFMPLQDRLAESSGLAMHVMKG